MNSFSSRGKRALFYVCLLAVFALLVEGGLWLVADSRAKLSRGQTTQAQVTGKSITVWGKHSQFIDRYLHFQYKIGKAVYTNKDLVDEEKYNATSIGSRFTVTYLPESPGNIEIGVVSKATVKATITFTTAILVFIGTIFLGIIVANESMVRGQARFRDKVSQIYLSRVLSQRTAGGSSERGE